MALSERIKKLDFMKIIPEQMKQASWTGLAFSVLFFVLVSMMILNQMLALFQYDVESELLIDHFKDDQDMQINLDVTFPNYPCAMISLDKMDVLHTHIMDVEENLQKIRINKRQKIIQKYQNIPNMSTQERVEIIRGQVKNQEGCRLKGSFSAKQVPGNFHIAMHNYVQEYQTLLREGLYQPDFDHVINQLEFGNQSYQVNKKIKRDFSLKTLATTNGKEHTGLRKELGFPHGVNHTISIIPSKFEYGPDEVYDMFQYSISSYKIAMGSMRVTFEFDVENFYMHYKVKSPNYTHILIQILSIIGGFYTVLMILKSFLEDGVMNMAFKRRIGKLE